MDPLIHELMKTELLQDVSDDIMEQVSSHARPFTLIPGELLLTPERR